uniref:Protein DETOXIFICATION n=1 Tax=Tetraselmis sp. GSL018 TaxID=582737 RepID=A0A061S3Z1_9CHLO|mmetsp:Transcript_42419/g.100673  ORF Transcript_42419/g.100673 Transcript_42419/m.100673 type:complete len:512 (-) Transcript_42419:468-2003(-)|eukprot:CAMPEP_0177606780 /NCGR_PEP_ID=MMETSP0419_2-20121207/17503_1 /TAXON_ID=582737 /ORGANISM="Tetraselmis sp., Strain GSL018" /LENGTH=511 /DNA_ID=CAMNT_0019101191 /DNA_START=47 /DNA_END=1582 /DNA_ORIENTATION=-
MSSNREGHEAELGGDGANVPLLGNCEDGDHIASAATQVSDLPTRGAWKEFLDLLYLTSTIFVARVSWVVIKTTDSALLGYTGTRYLAAASVSDLWTQSTGVFIMGGVLSTFCSQAIGAGNKALAGIWLQVSLTVLGVVLIPVAACWSVTGLLLSALGQPQQLAGDASYFALVLMLCLPARVGVSQVTQFFTSMKVMQPSMVTGVLAMSLNLALGLVLVLGVGVPGWRGFGFLACPAVTTCVEYAQLAVLWGVYWSGLGLYRECWPDGGWSLSHVTAARVRQFCHLYFPAALGLASDFWRVAAVGSVAAHLGPAEVSVFNCSYRIMWICLTFIGSMGGAMGIHVGVALGGGRVGDAKLTCAVALGTCAALVLALAAALLLLAREAAALFSPDPAIRELFHEVRVPMVAMMVLMNLAVLLERVPMAMGRSKVVLGIGLVGSWVGQVPGVLGGVFLWRHDLVGLFSGVAAGYALLCAMLAGIILTTDWHHFALEAQRRSEVAKPPPPPAQADEA